jgi:alpha-beta hydrolase superfamily lysophospholipase
MRNAVVAMLIALGAYGSSGLVAQVEATLDDLIAEKKAGPQPYVLSEWEQAFVRTEADLYAAPEPRFVIAEDGLRLAYREWIPDKWSGSGQIYLIVPGSTSHSLHFRFLGSALSDRGILTRVIDLRGTGFSVCKSAEDCGSPAEYTSRVAVDDGAYFPGRIGDAADANQIARDLETHLRDLRAKWPGARVHLSGHSSGGGLICRFVETVGRDESKELERLVDSIVLLAPFVHWNYTANTPANSKYSTLHMPTVMEVARGATHRYTVGFNLGDRRDDPWVVWKWTQEMASAMAAYGPTSAWPFFTVPTAYVIGTREELFDIDKARKEHAKAASPGPFVVLDGASHIGMRWREDLADFMASFAGNGP